MTATTAHAAWHLMGATCKIVPMDESREITKDDGPAPNAARAYDKEVRRLAGAEDPLDANAVLRCLLLRDTVARRHAHGDLNAGDVTTVLKADETLEGLAARLALVPQLDAFRQRFTPSAEAWWWYLRPPSWAARHDGLWKTLTLLCLALTISLVTDLGRRFNFDGVDLMGAIVIVLPTLLSAISAGSVLSQSLRERLAEVYGWLRIPTPWRSMATALGAFLVFALVAAGWWARPQIAGLYNDQGMKAFKEKRLAAAEAAFQRAVRLDPSYARAHYNLGSTYEEMQQNDRAMMSYQVAF
ncbi:MAG: tetratricopeptide repeat protein, partial [bacterium]|nr:tetratricopeptide repeat protein [bacterium]